jgi:hypothetical protein
MLLYNQYKELFSAKLDDFAESNGVVKMLSERTQLQEKVLVRYISTGLVMILLLMSFQALFSSMFCLVIPIYMSLKALAHSDAHAAKLCLNYWVLYASFSILEIVAYPVIYFIPLWGIVRCIIMFWLYCPVTQGGIKIMAMLSPLFMDHLEFRIDAVIQSIPGVAKLIGKEKNEKILCKEKNMQTEKENLE